MDGKWISGLTPDQRSIDAAAIVLQARLSAVVDRLVDLERGSVRNPEIIHQLRVATRRADASIRVFRPFLPRRTYRESRNRLRAIRRSAGEARDGDVMLLSLVEHHQNAQAKDLPGLDCLLGMALALRIEAQAQVDVLESSESFRDFVEDVLSHLRDPDVSEIELVTGLSNQEITTRLERFNQSTTLDLAEYHNLHQVRIAGKRLRYSLEIFIDCTSSSNRDVLLPMIEELQEILGRANDCHVAQTRLSQFRDWLKIIPDVAPRLKVGINALLKQRQNRLRQARRKFTQWMKRWQAMHHSFIEQD